MRQSTGLSKNVTRVVFVGLASALLGSTTFAKTVRDHRGQGPTPQTTPQLSCGSFKYCAKQGVIVRDHRTGAAPGGK